ncbi:RNA polymerase sigma-70 factor (sigma-E family) [Catenulispora sp. GAS73]|uniref:SigE family RNA polymerase sigma factor n=1 Tax=Catenulispora sp. GAS73 TaxID=3156269 RepID=UPI003511D3A6
MALTDREEQEFWDFVTARRRSLIRTAYLLSGDPHAAEDYVQEALLRVYHNWRRIERLDQPEAYARKVVVNLVNSWWRLVLKRKTYAISELSDRPYPTDDYAAVERSDELWRAMLKLPPGMRTMLVLRYYEGLTEAETAAILSKSLGTVKSQSARGLARMRNLLNPVDHSPDMPTPQNELAYQKAHTGGATNASTR